MAAATTTASATTAAESTYSLPSPWAKVVKGAGELPEKAESPPPENVEGNVGIKTAWNKPVNAISPPPLPSPPPRGGDHGVAIDAAWPALSESTRLPLKSSSSSSDLLKSVPEVSAPVSPGPSTLHSQHFERGSGSVNQYSSINAGEPFRQKSMKRGGGGGGGNKQGGFSGRTPTPPPLPTFPVSVAVAGPDLSFRETRHTGGFGSHTNSSNQHPNQRSTNRRGNFGHHGRGDGRSNYHGGRRDQDNKNHDWNSSSSPHGRGSHGHPHRPHGRGFMGPPVQGASQFVAPSPVRPYGNAFVCHDPALVYCSPYLPPDSFSGMPYITGPPPPPFLVMSDPLRLSIIQQIEYYFSDANLVKDQFLRSKMDEQGWVPITLIASFPRVQSLTESIPFILDCLKGSTILEVQSDKIRRCDDWIKWIAPQQSQSDSVSYDGVTLDMQRVGLEENRDNTSSMFKEKDMVNNLQATNMEGSIQRVF